MSAAAAATANEAPPAPKKSKKLLFILIGVLVLGLLLVRTADDVWMAYVVMTLIVTASAFFEPARTATIPNVTSQDELLSAGALSSARSHCRSNRPNR